MPRQRPRSEDNADAASCYASSSSSSEETTITVPETPTIATITTATTPTTLLSLPPELLYAVAAPLPTSAIHALTLTHPRLYALLNEYLYTLAPPGVLIRQVKLNSHPRASGRNLQPILLLLGRRDQVQSVDRGGWTALHWAARRGDLEAVRLLLDVGVRIGVRNNAGRTSVHCAAMAGRGDVVAALLERWEVMTEEEEEEEEDEDEVMDEFEEGSVSGLAPERLVDARDFAGVTPIEMAVRRKSADALRVLLRYGAKWEGVCGVAVKSGCEEVVEVLREWAAER
ncbi:ankyrin [Wilcoxina mikolae CBS 423.85]|nr:ankyrin [Wilcoxina mikolae CBS 423.85]